MCYGLLAGVKHSTSSWSIILFIFPRVAVIGEFSVYNNTLFKNNYFLFSSNNESQGTPLLFTPNHMIYQVDNVSVGDVITLSFNDYPNWQVEIDGVNLPKNPNQNFIQVNSTKSGTITIDYSWVAAPIEL